MSTHDTADTARETATATTINALRAAVAARKDSIIALRARIWALLEELPSGVRLMDEDDELLQIRKVYSAAQQQGHGWPVVGNSGRGAVTPDGRTVATEDMDRWDGSNWQVAFGPVLDRNDNALPYLSAADTRKLALRLPKAIARYMDECEVEASANAAVVL